MITINRTTLATLNVPTIEAKFGAGEPVYNLGAPTEFAYTVDKGALFRFQLLSGNRRSIREFLLPGDGFGLELNQHYHDAVRTLKPTTLLATRKKVLLTAARTNRKIANLLLDAAARSAMAAEQQGHRLRVMAAAEQVAFFLLDMESRLSVDGKLNLPMSRRHIADYLGITLETVSRLLNGFQTENIIQCLDTRQREIIIQDRERLQRLTSDGSACKYWETKKSKEKQTTNFQSPSHTVREEPAGVPG